MRSAQPPLAAPTSEVEDLRSLTSLRFFAAMFIVVLHAKLYVDWSWLRLTPPTLVHGVSFFFVLSGFILTHVYTSKPMASVGQFLQLRVARLWPVHLASLILVLLFIRPMTFAGAGITDPRLIFAANVLLLQSIVPLAIYHFGFNSVSWSVSTEMFFYATFPILLYRLRSSWHWKLAATTVFTFGLFYCLSRFGLPLGSEDVSALSISSLTYANPAARLFEFVLGVASCVIWSRCLRPRAWSRWQWTAFELVALGLTVWWLLKLYVTAYAEISLPWMLIWYSSSGSCFVFAGLIAVLASGRGLVGKVLSLGLMVWLGEISYCIYMVHQILFKILAFNWPQLATPLIYFSALVAASAAMHYAVEKPGRMLLRRLHIPGALLGLSLVRKQAKVS